MQTRSMNNKHNNNQIMIEPEYSEMDEPEYMYIHLTCEKRIPSVKQVHNYMKMFGVVDEIYYDMSKSGVISGIYVYFDFLDAKCHETMIILSNMKYGGTDTIRLKFKNSLRITYEEYDVTAVSSRRQNTEYIPSILDDINPVPMRRSSNRPLMTSRDMTEALYEILYDVRQIKGASENRSDILM